MPEPPKELKISISEKPTTTAELFHQNLVAKAVKAIEKGLFSKVVLSRAHEVSLSENPLKILPELFVKLHTLYPTAMVYCWYHPSIGYWMGATPEKLFSVEGTRINTMALAGTQNFVDGQEAVWGAKEREEQQLVTNLLPTVYNLSLQRSA